MKPISVSMAALALPLLLPLLLPFAGCGEKGVDPGPTVQLVKPKAGSWYVMRNTMYDTTGAVRGTRYDTITIVATGLTVAGKTDVMGVTSTASPDTNYARFEANGDFTTFGGLDTNHDGKRDGFTTRTLPFMSKGRSLYGIDTLPATGTFSILRDSMIYQADESLTVPAGTFATSKVLQVNDIVGYNNAGVPASRVRELATYYFAPSIGFYIRAAFEHDHLDMAGTSFSRKTNSVFELVSYQLK